ncbi:hypothetical protein LCL96_07675 [Rossellomorea aquimaris]|uniref:hypothetical protein n=1 Tax=Rossellomorea aquimaris TaxID=189382 RepID=UPI001CD5C7BE|nr:hypothetical protein [Rossellomorea aquimaris]MCA1058808.1 hypothetical protein [Rossellomorea aquimaris]
MARFVFMLVIGMMFVTNQVQQQTYQSNVSIYNEVETISNYLLLTDASMILDSVPSLVLKQDDIPPKKIKTITDRHFDIKTYGASLFYFDVFPDSLGFLEVIRSHSNYLKTLHLLFN